MLGMVQGNRPSRRPPRIWIDNITDWCNYQKWSISRKSGISGTDSLVLTTHGSRVNIYMPTNFVNTVPVFKKFLLGHFKVILKLMRPRLNTAQLFTMRIAILVKWRTGGYRYFISSV